MSELAFDIFKNALNKTQYFRAWLYDEGSDPLVRRLSRRISDATDLNTTHPTAEALQVSNQKATSCSLGRQEPLQQA